MSNWLQNSSNLANTGNEYICVKGLHKARQTVSPKRSAACLLHFFLPPGTGSHFVKYSHCVGWTASCLCSVHMHQIDIWFQLVNPSWCFCHTQNRLNESFLELFIQDLLQLFGEMWCSWNKLDMWAEGAWFFCGYQVQAGAAKSTAGAGKVFLKKVLEIR